MNFKKYSQEIISWELILLLTANLFFPFTFYLDAPNYEFTLINSLLLFFLFGSVSIRKEKISILLFGIFLVAPVLISIISNIIQKNCPFDQSIIFYFLNIIPLLFLSYSLASTSFILAELFNTMNNKNIKIISYLIFLIFFVLMALESLLEFYYYPQVYFFNPIIGYFSGTIYDDKIDISSTLILYRFVILLFSLFLIAVKRSTKKYLYFGLIFVFYMIFILLKPLLGFSTNEERIVEKQGSVIHTDHFNIVLPKEVDTSFVDFAVREHEYFFSKYYSIFQLNTECKITSFVFRNTQEKRELFGAGNADVAKPWLNQIYTDINSIDKTLEHELLHIFSAEFGVTPFKISHNFNPYLLEGLPTAFVGDINNRSIHYFAKLLDQNNVPFTLENFNSLFSFFSVNSSISYIYAGSFIKFLADNYSNEKVLELYSSGDFNTIYGKSLEKLLNEYKSFLDSLKYQYAPKEFEFYFGRAPIYSRVCPRELAAKKELAEKYYLEDNYGASLEIYKEIFSISRDPGALTGIINNYRKLREYSSAVKLISENMESFKNSNYFLYLNLMQLDLTYLDYTSKHTFVNDKLDYSDTIQRLSNYNDSLKTNYAELKSNMPNFSYNVSLTIREELSDYPDILLKFLENGVDSAFISEIEKISSNTAIDMIRDYFRIISPKSNLEFKDYNWEQFIDIPYFEEFFLSVSKRLIKIKKYSEADSLLTFTINNLIKEEFRYTINENLKKIEWLTNFGNQIKYIENIPN